MQPPESLAGKFLIAMPGIGDPRFERTVIFMLSHTKNGAMGIVINKAILDITFKELVAQNSLIRPQEMEEVVDFPLQFGGPVNTDNGFVLHTADYFVPENTMKIDERFAMTASLDLLQTIAHKQGPRAAFFVLGYAGWEPGQLENEIQENSWLHCEADEDLMFNCALDERYRLALRKIGIDLSKLSGKAGHA